ncbi:MAG: hypothetical protein K2L86_03065 [Lachnospiraceae bacterium]|nr:hypothetical protein [Lachnospiraceae bacterium]
MYRTVKKIIAALLCAALCVSTSAEVYAVQIDNYEELIQTSTLAESDSNETDSKETESDLTETDFVELSSDLPESDLEELESEKSESSKIESNPSESSVTESVESASAETETEEQISETQEEASTETAIESETASETDSELETDTALTESETETDIENSVQTEIELRDALKRKLEADGFVASGYLDSGMDAEPLSSNKSSLFTLSERSVPSQYSALEHGQETAIKDQGKWGSCWSFAAVASAESQYRMQTGTEADMSESHLIHFFYNDDLAGPDGGLEGDAVIPLATTKVNNGGNNMFTTFAMARWTGIADEKTHASLVYPSAEETNYTKELSIPQEYAHTDLVHMQNAYWIHKSDENAIKQAIMDKGAVATYYKHDEFHSSNYVDKSQYNGPTVYYNTINDGDNHAIAIVGWDDDFDRNLFRYTAGNNLVTQKDIPKNNGAWLIKNSWGTSYGDDGYFWMSYEEASLSDTMLVFDFEKADNYDHIYQYDGSAGVRYQSAETITAAAIYTGTGNQILKAVGVGVASVGTDYTIEIYTNLTDLNNPQSGELSSRMSGTTTFQGFHTMKLEKWVPLSEGETFSIVVSLSGGKINNEQGSAVFVDQSYDNGKSVRFVAKTNPGETFVKTSEGWKDAAGEDAEEKITYRIKAYTSDGQFDIPQENIPLMPEMVKEIDPQEYNGSHNEPSLELRYMGEALVRDIDYEVTYSDNDKAADKDSAAAPKAVITGIGKYVGTIERTFTILPKELTEEMAVPVTIPYNGTVQDDYVIQNNGIRLEKGTDYTITFHKEPRNAGTYTASITGINNYAGTLDVPLTITKTIITEDMVTAVDGSGAIPAQEYTAAAVKPTVKVLVNGVELPAASYSVSYKNNTNTGQNATVTVTGKGQCQGKVTKTFAIIPKPIESDCTITVAKAVYSGKALTPAVTVKWNKKTLKKGKDYTVSYEKNTHAADMSAEDAPCVTVTGVGNYTGKIVQPFTIHPKEIAESGISVQVAYDENGSRLRVTANKTELDETQYRKDTLAVYKAGTSTRVGMNELALGEKYDIEIALCGDYSVKNKDAALKKNVVSKKDINALSIRFADENAVYTYNAKAQKPKLIIQDVNGNAISTANYTLLYNNNINAGKDTASVTITGKGAYAGTRRLTFSIAKKKLGSAAIQPIKDQTYTQKEIRPAVKVLDGKKTLKPGEGKDYTIRYGNNVNVAYDEAGNVTAGAYVQIQLSDNYAIDPEAAVMYFKILPAAISSVTLSNAYFTGQPVLPDKVTVKAGKLVMPADAYELAAENHTEVSSGAVLTVTAKAGTNYTGSKSKKFSVVKQELKNLVLPVIPDQPYLNQPVTFTGYPIQDWNGQDIGENQYDITFKNNKKPGTASAVYRAKSDGLYKGSVTVKFKITKATIAQAIDYDAVRAIEKPYTGSEIILTDEELRQLAPIKGAPDGDSLPYTVTYSKNISAGTAVVRLTGTGYLYGSKNMYFTITPKSVGTLEITTGTKQLNYNDGKPVYLELKEVRDNGIVLRQGKDYTCSYANTTGKGIACMTITGVGSYTGTRYIYYSII